MASTYSNLKIQLMATGENSGTWGTVTNTNLGTAIEEAIAGSADVTFSSSNVTLTLTDTNASQTARNMRLNLTGTTGGARDLIVPAIEKMYVVNNGCADTVTVKVSGQTGIGVPAGKSMILYNNGTDVGLAFSRLVGDVVGGNISGNGAGITAMNATELTTGTIANGRTTASSSNGASTIVARDASGNFAGNVITSVNSNASSAFNLSNWTITQNSTTLSFRYNGTAKFSIDSNGNVTASNNVTAYGTPV